MDRLAPTVAHPWVEEGRGKLRFGIGLPSLANDWAAQRDLVQAVDALGFDSLWVIDHPSLVADCWITLTAYATWTRRVRLGSLVSCASYRSPWMLARQAVDVDRLSGGRLVLGVGAGWFANEFAFLRVPFGSPGDRVRHLGETVREIRRRLASPPPSSLMNGSSEELLATQEILTGGFGGAFVQQPSIPLLIGGSGEKVILRLVAESSDVCNVESSKASTPAEVAHKFDVLRGYCIEQGRSPETVLRSHYHNVFVLAETEAELREKAARHPASLSAAFSNGAYTFDALAAYYRPIIAAGAEYLIFVPFGVIDVATLRLVAERVFPELQDYFASVIQ